MSKNKIFVVDEQGAREHTVSLRLNDAGLLDYLRGVMQVPISTPLNFFQLPEIPELSSHILVGPMFLGNIHPFAPASEFLSFRVETDSGVERCLIHGPIVVAGTPIPGNFLGQQPQITVEELNNLFTPFDKLEMLDAFVSE